MATVVADLVARLRGDTTQFNSAMASAQATTATTTSKIGSSMGAMAKSIGGAFALYQVTAFVKGALREAEEAQRVSRQTAAVIKSTGGVAGVSAKQVEKYATKLSRLAAIDDEVVQSSENMLLTFKNIGGDTFPRAMKAIVDTAAGMAALNNTEIDLSATTLQVGKALNDPIAGMTALTRVGIQFSDSQKQNIADMMAFGNIAGAQTIILGELESQFGGSAAAGVTASAQLGVAWGNFQEMIGKLLLPLLERITPIFQSILTWVTKNWSTVATLLKLAFLPIVIAYETAKKLKELLSNLGVGLSVGSEGIGAQVGRIQADYMTPPDTRHRRQHGGPVSPGTPYIVGEKRPELFVPDTAGRIIPNLNGMGGGTTVILNVAGSVVSERNLADKVHELLLQKQRKSGSLGWN